jgi:hypothetical protein
VRPQLDHETVKSEPPPRSVSAPTAARERADPCDNATERGGKMGSDKCKDDLRVLNGVFSFLTFLQLSAVRS